MKIKQVKELSIPRFSANIKGWAKNSIQYLFSVVGLLGNFEICLNKNKICCEFNHIHFRLNEHIVYSEYQDISI